MVEFLLYLFETGLCLSLLYLVYVFFFRNETYFNFNRFYLVGIIFASLAIPLVHVTFITNNFQTFDRTFENISKVRTAYTGYLQSSEFVEPNRYRAYNAVDFSDVVNINANNASGDFENLTPELPENIGKSKQFHFSAAVILKLFFWIYAIGLVVFVLRFIVISKQLYAMIRNNSSIKYKGYRLVPMKEEVPPFSFFRYIFVSKEALQLNEFEQILAHEQVHIRQKHSLDLMLAHFISVFQWFNPLVWRLQLAIKTTHEYIADHKVVNQGFELFDYQSLLLRQLISLRPVALVNNFNLISIKKRIAMMTKNKSRFPAKLKALIIIPAALFVFFLFAQLTVKSPVLSFTNFNKIKTSNLDGLWLNHNDKNFGKLIYFEGGKLSVLEQADNVNVIDLEIKIEANQLVLLGLGRGESHVKYEYSGNVLKLWWTDNEFSVYEKTPYKNSFQVLMPGKHQNIELPVMSEARILENQKYVYHIYVYPDKYYVEDKECNLSELKACLKNRVAEFNVLDRPFSTAHLILDKNTPMKSMFDLYQVLRELKLYKVAYAAWPNDNHSVLQYHASGIPQMLPPTKKDGAEILDYDDIGENLMVLSSDKNYNEQAGEFEQFLLTHPDYVAAYEWNNATLYKDYIAVINMAYEVIYKLRNQVAEKAYGIASTDLPDNLQREVRKENYPMRISQNNTDEDEN